MALFYFDTHNVDSAVWDDKGVDCAGRGEIEAHARRLAIRYASRHDGGKAPVSVIVFSASQKLVMVATIEGGSVQIAWRSPSAE